MRTRKIISLAGAAMLTLSLAACGTNTATATQGTGTGTTGTQTVQEGNNVAAGNSRNTSGKQPPAKPQDGGQSIQ